jgi:hypothetical protein
MISDAAALKLAGEILAPFIKGGVADESMIPLVASIISNSVEIDEADQVLEKETHDA